MVVSRQVDLADKAFSGAATTLVDYRQGSFGLENEPHPSVSREHLRMARDDAMLLLVRRRPLGAGVKDAMRGPNETSFAQAHAHP
jgi:hypothetical protein